jgi:transposase
MKATKFHTDDTPVPVLDPGRGKTATGRLWTYVVDDRASGSAKPPLAWYRFTPDRTGAHPQKDLAEFTGHLQADAYAGYDKLYQSGRVTEVACWAHFRRKIFDIHKPRPTTLTTDILERIAALYAIEAEVRGAPPDVRQKARQERTKPLIAELRKMLDNAHRRLSPKSVMALAIAYGTKRWTALTQFLDNGSLEIDNNIAERSLRSVAIGRKNSYDHCQRSTRGKTDHPAQDSLGWHRNRQRTRRSGFLDGRSNSCPGIGYPMMTVRRKASSFWLRT